MSGASTAPRRAYTRCMHGGCGLADCPQCHPASALRRFLDEVSAGRRAHLRALPERPVLLYHVPRSGGSFFAEVFERLEIPLVRPDYPGVAEAADELLGEGHRRGLIVLAHTAAAFKAQHPDVEFLEYGVTWRDPFEICASEYHGVRKAVPGYHLHEHHLRQQCLECDSIADWVERFGRGDPISKVLAGNRPRMLRASHYAEDVGEMLAALLGERFDLVRDFGFDPSTFRPGRWLRGVARDELLRLRDLNARDYELVARDRV